MSQISILFFILLSLLGEAHASRVCGTGTSTTYPWTIGDARYDGADPSKNDTLATVAISITPGNRGTLFECVAQWNESWAGWYNAGNSLVWADCIWTGNGPTDDTTASFALDWANRTMYLSHTFNCSDAPRSDALAMGQVNLNMSCAKGNDPLSHCDLISPVKISTRIEPPKLGGEATCENVTEIYKSWQLQNWLRRYEMAPGSPSPPTQDTGPSFSLTNLAISNVFDCVTIAKVNGSFSGACHSTEGNSISTTARFTFDPEFDFLTIGQSWLCKDSPSIDSTGIGYVQAACDREGEILTCKSKPLWIGTTSL